MKMKVKVNKNIRAIIEYTQYLQRYYIFLYILLEFTEQNAINTTVHYIIYLCIDIVAVIHHTIYIIMYHVEVVNTPK